MKNPTLSQAESFSSLIGILIKLGAIKEELGTSTEFKFLFPDLDIKSLGPFSLYQSQRIFSAQKRCILLSELNTNLKDYTQTVKDINHD